jgi:hypothetical protein
MLVGYAAASMNAGVVIRTRIVLNSNPVTCTHKDVCTVNERTKKLNIREQSKTDYSTQTLNGVIGRVEHNFQHMSKVTNME